MLDAKEKTTDPLKQFYSGAKRQIYDDIVATLRAEEPNLADLTGTDFADLKQLIGSPTPYKGNTLQQAKTKLENLRAQIATVVKTTREAALATVEQAVASVRAASDFAALPAADQTLVLAPFEKTKGEITSERLAPVIRQQAQRVSQDLLPAQLQRVSELAAARRKESGAPAPSGEIPQGYVAAQRISVPFQKKVLETEADLEAYLDAIRAAYAAEIKARKRITL